MNVSIPLVKSTVPLLAEPRLIIEVRLVGLLQAFKCQKKVIIAKSSIVVVERYQHDHNLRMAELRPKRRVVFCPIWHAELGGRFPVWIWSIVDPPALLP